MPPDRRRSLWGLVRQRQLIPGPAGGSRLEKARAPEVTEAPSSMQRNEASLHRCRSLHCVASVAEWSGWPQRCHDEQPRRPSAALALMRGSGRGVPGPDWHRCIVASLHCNPLHCNSLQVGVRATMQWTGGRTEGHPGQGASGSLSAGCQPGWGRNKRQGDWLFPRGLPAVPGPEGPSQASLQTPHQGDGERREEVVERLRVPSEQAPATIQLVGNGGGSETGATDHRRAVCV
jgi:hypothetical protein